MHILCVCVCFHCSVYNDRFVSVIISNVIIKNRNTLVILLKANFVSSIQKCVPSIQKCVRFVYALSIWVSFNEIHTCSNEWFLKNYINLKSLFEWSIAPILYSIIAYHVHIHKQWPQSNKPTFERLFLSIQ